MPDHRTTNLWDEGRVVSQWFSKHVDGDQGYLWDAYFLYGGDARWQDSASVPTSLISSGGTVLDKRDQLEASILPLLNGK